MKIPAFLPAGLCIAGGVLLAGYNAYGIITGSQEFKDIVFAGMGLYFIGNGLFAYCLSQMMEDL